VELEGVEGLEQRFFAEDGLDADAGGVIFSCLEEVGDLSAELFELLRCFFLRGGVGRRGGWREA
jgi:hypothetical protein